MSNTASKPAATKRNRKEETPPQPPAAAALREISTILVPLSDDERYRVLRAVALLFDVDL